MNNLIPGNAFRGEDGKLDRQYMRVSAVYRLLDRGKIDKNRALELLMERFPESKRNSLANLVSIWARVVKKRVGNLLDQAKERQRD